MINKALLNQKIIKWYKSLPLITSDGALSRSQLVVMYAASLQCPICEVVADFTDEDDLQFLYKNYKSEIDRMS